MSPFGSNLIGTAHVIFILNPLMRLVRVTVFPVPAQPSTSVMGHIKWEGWNSKDNCPRCFRKHGGCIVKLLVKLGRLWYSCYRFLVRSDHHPHMKVCTRILSYAQSTYTFDTGAWCPFRPWRLSIFHCNILLSTTTAGDRTSFSVTASQSMQVRRKFKLRVHISTAIQPRPCHALVFVNCGCLHIMCHRYSLASHTSWEPQTWTTLPQWKKTWSCT
jgi:hypothetical protein